MDCIDDESDIGKKKNKIEKTQKFKMAAIYMNTAITRVALFRLKCKFLERDHINNRKYLSNKKKIIVLSKYKMSAIFMKNWRCPRKNKVILQDAKERESHDN